MRIAVISDIHSNLHALEAVVAAIDGERADTVWCLGDVVGYGPHPNRCCNIVIDRSDICLVGNHDLGVIDALDISEFSPDAEEATLWTRDVLRPVNEEFLSSLEPAALTEPAALYHGSPRDPVWEYVLSEEAALAALGDSPRDLVLVGHSHVALAISLADDRLDGGLAPDGTEISLDGEGRWLLNPGSVGQPRDSDPRAAWLLLDLDAGHVTFHREDYDIQATQNEILDAGLPESLAIRLAEGV